jgi:hypothetical protein
MSDWGQGAKNNNIGWGQGAVNNNISWGSVHANSWAGNTDIVGENAIAPVNTITPVVSGTNTVGSILTTTNGSWSGSLPITYTYQWLRNGSNIGGETSSTYTLVTADTSNVVSCRVTATNSVGSANATSNSLTIYESEYKAILDYATTQGYTLPTPAQRLKQNTLLSSLKTAGVWNKLDTFANFATDGSTQFALIDWKRLVQYNASTGPTFTTNEGFTGNGTSSYIDTNFNPATSGGSNYTLNNASRYLYMYMASGTGPLDGVTTASLNNMARTSTSNHRINSTAGLTGGTFDFNATRGMKSIHRTSSLNVTLFNDNTASTPQRTASSTSLRSENQFILRSGSTVGSYGAHEISMYAMGANLVSENAAFLTAYNTYINSL